MDEETRNELKNPIGIKPKDPKTSDKKIIPLVLEGAPVKRKKSIAKRIIASLTGDNVDNVRDYVIQEVVVPSLKNLLFDAFSEGSRQMIFGSSRRPSSNGRVAPSYTSYSKYYNQGGSSSTRTESRDISQSARAAHNFDEIVLPSRTDAETVLEALMTLVDQYGLATVSDLYDLLAITSTYTDNKWGWDDLSGVSIQNIREGFLLNLPKPMPLERV